MLGGRPVWGGSGRTTRFSGSATDSPLPVPCPHNMNLRGREDVHTSRAGPAGARDSGVPPRAGVAPPAFAGAPYKHRNVAERCFNRLKQWRGVATRYDKRADNCCGGCARRCARQRRLERASRGLARAWRTAGPARCGAAGHGQAGGSWLYRGACRRPRKPRPRCQGYWGCGLGCVAEGADPSVWICSSPQCSRSSPAVTALSESSDLRVVRTSSVGARSGGGEHDP